MSGLPAYTDLGADLSDEHPEDGGPLYRYRLWRTWRGATIHRVTWLMLNPSTADDRTDDNTIRRCVGFADSWGYGGIDVVNLYAWRARHPRDLPREPARAIGPGNDRWISCLTVDSQLHTDPPRGRLVVAGWGGFAHARDRGPEVLRRLRVAGVAIHCVGVNRDNSPGHPLFVPKATRPKILAGVGGMR